MARRTQTDAVLEHIRRYGSITSMEAFEEYGITRLSSIIFGLRHRGLDIETIPLECVTRFGNRTKYAKYVLHEV